MVHTEAIKFLNYGKQVLPEYFINKKILDVGCGDINGNNRYLFENCEYNGNDVIECPNATIISKTKDLSFNDHTFDVIISSECFEHDPEYKKSILNIYRMLKPNGLFIFTCASEGRPEHGTKRTTPNDSYGTIGNLEDMSDYYKNLEITDIDKIKKIDKVFSYWKSYYNYVSSDLYFIGIKKGDKKITFNDYEDRFIMETTIW